MSDEASPSFTVEGETFSEMRFAVQVAECLHAGDDVSHEVVADTACPYGMFEAGEVVYTSKGGPNGQDDSRQA